VDHHSLVTTKLAKPNSTGKRNDHTDDVHAFLMKYYGNEKGGTDITRPLGTISTRDRFGLIIVRGQPYQIVDIGMRMLQPNELFAAQGFPKDYIYDRLADGTKVNKTDQVKMCGNSVCPQMAEAIVRANQSQEMAWAA